MAKYPNNKKENPAEFEDVYAGPGMMDEIGGPEDIDPQETSEEEAPPVPEDLKGPDSATFMMVYAGPSFMDRGFTPPPQPGPMECVYAGPDYFENKQPAGFFVSEMPEPETKKCPFCGSDAPLFANFCPQCGKPFPDDVCRRCGAQLAEGAKFCPECGTPRETETV